jgi:NHL repeat
MKMKSFSFDSTRLGRRLAAALFFAGLQLLVTFPNGNLLAGGENEEGRFFRWINLQNLEGLFEKEEGHFFKWINLQSDIAGVADRTDSKYLINPWGLAVSPTGIFWVADNHTGVSTLYEPNGEPFPEPTRFSSDGSTFGWEYRRCCFSHRSRFQPIFKSVLTRRR